MAPKKSKESTSQASPTTHFKFRNFIFQLISRLVCNFYLLVVIYTGKGIYTILQVLFGMIRDVIKILLVLVARVVSDICYGAALIVEKILEAVLNLFLELAVITGSLINQTVIEFVDQVGYSISSGVFIAVTVFVWSFIVPVLEQFGHAVVQSFNELVTQLPFN